jgi:hypothetical protein
MAFLLQNLSVTERTPKSPCYIPPPDGLARRFDRVIKKTGICAQQADQTHTHPNQSPLAYKINVAKITAILAPAP